MQKAAKILVVGLGSIGKKHFENLLLMGYKNLIACDSDAGAFTGFRKNKQVKFYKDFKRAIDLENPDVVFVCTPPSGHVKVADYATKFKCGLFVEKPIANKTSDLSMLINNSRRSGNISMVSSNWQFREAYIELEKLIKSKKYGKVLGASVAVSYFLPDARRGVDYRKTYAAKRNGGGVVLDTGSHVIPYLIRLFGPIGKIQFLKSKLHTINIEAEEAALASCEFESGLIASVWMDYISKKPIHTVDAFFEKGNLLVDMRKNTIVLENEKGTKAIFKGNADLNKMFVDELKYFLDCIARGEKPTYGLVEAKRDLETLLKK